jgi:hypothetical protein
MKRVLLILFAGFYVFGSFTAVASATYTNKSSSTSHISEGSACKKGSTPQVGPTFHGVVGTLICQKDPNGTLWKWHHPIFGESKNTNSTPPVLPVSKATKASSSPPKSFDELLTHLSGIVYGAWQKVGNQIDANNSNLGNLHILVGPNTKEDDSDSSDALELISKLYSNFTQVKNLYLIKFSSSDTAWAQQQYDILHPNNYDQNSAEQQCRPTFGCDGGSTGINKNGDGVIMLGQGGNYDNQPLVAGLNNATSGHVISHEYTHTIQMLNAPCEYSSGCYGDLPQWLLEGSAEFSATAAIYKDNFQNYLIYRGTDLSNQYKDPTQFSADWINTFLNPSPTFIPNTNNWTYWQNYDRWDVYSIGYLVDEILVNINGPDSLMNLYKDVGSGQTFVQAFQSEFGISWNSACPLISNAIAQELKLGINRN